MEEQQIQEFVRRTTLDRALRSELGHNARGVIAREGFSGRVAGILLLLAPYLAFGQPLSSAGKWWHV